MKLVDKETLKPKTKNVTIVRPANLCRFNILTFYVIWLWQPTVRQQQKLSYIVWRLTLGTFRVSIFIDSVRKKVNLYDFCQECVSLMFAY